jgi:hypothetical protein
MRIQQFLDHHGIARNPFAEEDAATDPVFKDHCIDSTYHPTWDKVYGDPREPSTAIVFGEKGAGKTAVSLQIARHLEQFNRDNSGQRLLVIHYDDFNPFLDRFRDRLGRSQRRPDRVLAQWKLWDHMDAILAIGVTGLIDRLLDVKNPSTMVQCDVSPADVEKLDRYQARDLLLLAACYDQSTAATFKGRWHELRRKLKFWPYMAWWDLALGIGWSVLWLVILIVVISRGLVTELTPFWFTLALVLLIGPWVPYLWRLTKTFFLARKVLRRIRTGNHEANPLRQLLMHFTPQELSSQPLPTKDSTDDRYEMLLKLQGVLKSLGYRGIIVLVDRVDEPHLINGSAELMKSLVWPMLDNKFLKHPGLGIKLMLPVELTRFIDREERDFYQRARLDKQNMIPAFEWTGEALYDVTNARIRACASPGATPSLRMLIAPSLSDARLIEALRSLRVPRRLFKYLYRLLVVHCNAHSDENPVWQVSPETFEATLALCLRDQDAFDRGVGAG